MYAACYDVDFDLPAFVYRLDAASRIEFGLVFDTLNIYLAEQAICANQFQAQLGISTARMQIFEDLLFRRPADETPMSIASSRLRSTDPGVFIGFIQPAAAHQKEYIIWRFLIRGKLVIDRDIYFKTFNRLIYIVGRLFGKAYIRIYIQIAVVYINLDIIEWPNG